MYKTKAIRDKKGKVIHEVSLSTGSARCAGFQELWTAESLQFRGTVAPPEDSFWMPRVAQHGSRLSSVDPMLQHCAGTMSLHITCTVVSQQRTRALASCCCATFAAWPAPCTASHTGCSQPHPSSLQLQDFQSKELPNSRIQPDRRWFGNTRVVGQKQLEQFRTEMSTKVGQCPDGHQTPYSASSSSSELGTCHLMCTEGSSSAPRSAPTLSLSTRCGSKVFGSRRCPGRLLTFALVSAPKLCTKVHFPVYVQQSCLVAASLHLNVRRQQ